MLSIYYFSNVSAQLLLQLQQFGVWPVNPCLLDVAAVVQYVYMAV